MQHASGPGESAWPEAKSARGAATHYRGRGPVRTRVLDAPRDLVFQALTAPERLRRCVGGRTASRAPVCTIDLRQGDSYTALCDRPRAATRGVSMPTHRFNWPIWAGFLLSWMALLSYFFVFVWFPVTRNVPWANLLLFGIAAALVLIGVRRAYAPGRPRRAKIAGIALATISIALCGCFVFATLDSGTALAHLAKRPPDRPEGTGLPSLRYAWHARLAGRDPRSTRQWTRAEGCAAGVLPLVPGDRHATPSYGVSSSILRSSPRWGFVRWRSASMRPRSRARCVSKARVHLYHLKNPGLKAHALAGCHEGGKLA